MLDKCNSIAYIYSMRNEKTIKEYEVQKTYRILGFNDDQCECDVCGKQELKGTYVMEVVATGEIFRAGSTCGAKMAGWTTKELVAEYKASEKQKLENAKKELRASEEYGAYNAGLDFLNAESDELQRRALNCRSDEGRAALRLEERTMESRMAYLRPLHIALHNKKKEVVEKYGLPEKTYLS